MLVDIKETAKVKLKNPVLIEGFPGVGMVGTISASYLAEKLDLQLIGYIQSTHFPPIVAIHNYAPMSPARIYASEKHDLLVLFSEFIVPAELVYALSQKILQYAQDKKARAVYSLAGIASPQPDGKIYGIASTKKMGDLLKKEGVELIREGATQGVSGVLIAEAASMNFPAANLLIQTVNPMEPAGSAKLLDKLSKIVGFEVDTSSLLKQGKDIQQKLKENMEKIKTLHTSYNEMEGNPAYG